MTERPERRLPKPPRDPMPNSSDPIDIAMVAAVSGKPLPEVARRLLEEQADLIHAQCTELRVRHVGERVRAALWAILAVVALALSGLLVALLVRAARADALIVESFRVPPAMATQGLTGEVVASQVLDKLAELQTATNSVRAASSYDNNWGDELKIDIPNTGATADQLWKLLRSWLGKETRISGEIIDTSNGLALTARVGGTPGKRFVSKTEDLDALVAQGAELIFRQSQPYRHAVYLLQDPKRFAEGMQLLERLTRDPSERERKWANNGLSWAHRTRGEFRTATMFAKKALAIDPAMLPAASNLASAFEALGQEQAQVDSFRRALELPESRDYDPRNIASNRCGAAASIAFATRDPKGLDEAGACYEAAQGEGDSTTRLNGTLSRHDVPAARRFKAAVAAGDPAAFARTQDASARLFAATEQGSASALVFALEDYRSAMTALQADQTYGTYARGLAPVWQWPTEVEALIKLGRLPEAAALIARTPRDCYTCVRTRGMVAEAAGNSRQAQRWYAEAARQGPRLAPAFADWGRLLVKARRHDAAEVKLKEAARLAPNWADPLKYWGDSLVAQGKPDAAIAKYDAALKLAPQWPELRQARASLRSR